MNLKLSHLLLLVLPAIYLILFPVTTSLAKDFGEHEITHIEYPLWFKKDPFTNLGRGTG